MRKRNKIILIYIILVLIFSLLFLCEFNWMKKSNNMNTLTYNEKSGISYKVALKDKFVYDEPYLDEEKTYIASLIDKFIINYNYINVFSDNIKYTLDYNIKANLIVYDSNNDTKPVYTKNYILLDNKRVTKESRVAKVDILNQEIDYNEYNKVINELKKEIIPNAKLVINFNTSFKGKNSNIDKQIVSNKTSSLSIPISQRTINVDLKKNNLSDSKTISNSKSTGKFILILAIFTGIILFLLIICFLHYLIRPFHRVSKYNQEINKILREYDRAITEAKGEYKFNDNDNNIEIKDFMELLDVHDNLNVPIIYYKVSNRKSLFIIRNNKDVYYNVITKEDFE